MKNYSTILGNTPQNQPIPGRGMTANNAGGFGFDITPQERLERFLLIGSEGGTYHVGEQKLTAENAENVIKLIKSEGMKVVATVVDFATNSRAPKADAGIFVLALAATYGDANTKATAYSAIHTVCRTSTHLFNFLANVQNLRSWSRGLRTGVSKFYTTKTPEKVAYQLVKYRNRAGFTHRDAIRLSHPTATSPQMNDLFGYAVEKKSAQESGSVLIAAYEAAQHTSGKELVGLIKEYKLTWEMVPTEHLNDKEVLKALLPNMPLVALIRNLNRFSYNGLTETQNDTVKQIVGKLIDAESVKKSGIHPLNVVNAIFTYGSGKGQKGDKTWTVNRNITDALNVTFELALKALVPTGKTILIGVDVSGSMTHQQVGSMQMTPAQIANVLSIVMLKSELNAEMVWFDTEIQNPELSRQSSLREVVTFTPRGGGTDCAQPFVHALKTKTKYDAIVILTDSETWAGSTHGTQVLDKYRKQINKDVKVVEVAMVANHTSTIPENDKNLLRVTGFDSSVTSVINEFLK